MNLIDLVVAWVQDLYTGPHQYPSTVPCTPTQSAFQVYSTVALQVAKFDLAASTALECALLHPNAAQATLTAALSGAAKHHWTWVMNENSDATLPQWLYNYWHKFCKEGDVSLAHDTAALHPEALWLSA